MEDSKIIELYWMRSEEAIRETAAKYGKLCRYIAKNILANTQDAEECVNDTYLGAWNAIPPQKPNKFSAFIGRITRNLALKKYEYVSTAKRNPEVLLSLTELEECVSGQDCIEVELENKRIEKAISDFLWQQDIEKRTVFIRRYWYFESIDSICRHCGFSQSKLTSMLYHTRQKLRQYLESEGIEL
ncbi:MAG: sigma-70 family RNA polymerase sigma factor [Clostridiales bacterium]|nr:sigma-70 family RNA polymerase sigma factor [Clostridiales bacterium]